MVHRHNVRYGRAEAAGRGGVLLWPWPGSRDVPRWHVAWVGWWYAPTGVRPGATNSGHERVHALIARGAERHPDLCTWTDASGLSDPDRWALYAEFPVNAAVGWNVAARGVYGSRAHPDRSGGVGVSLLALRFAECDLALVATHYEWQIDPTTGRARRPYRFRTALELLRLVSPDQQLRLFGEMA